MNKSEMLEQQIKDKISVFDEVWGIINQVYSTRFNSIEDQNKILEPLNNLKNRMASEIHNLSMDTYLAKIEEMKPAS